MVFNTRTIFQLYSGGQF